MSYGVTLKKDDKVVTVERHQEGATVAIGGFPKASMDVTYNYGKFYRETLHGSGLRWLDGRKAKDCIPHLFAAVMSLGTKQSENYWEKTPGNAGHALMILLKWAKRHPEATFEVF